MGVFGASTSPDSDTGTLPNTRPWLRDQRGSKWRRASRCGSSAIAHSGSIAALVSDHTFSVSSSVADSTHGGGLDASGEPGNNWNLRPRGPPYWPRSVRWPSWVGRTAMIARCRSTGDQHGGCEGTLLDVRVDISGYRIH